MKSMQQCSNAAKQYVWQIQTTVGAVRFSDNCSRGNSQQCNVCNGVQILCSIKAANPQPFLPCLFETWIVTLSFGTRRINLLEGNTFTVNGKPVIIGECDILCAAPMLFAVIPDILGYAYRLRLKRRHKVEIKAVAKIKKLKEQKL